MSFNKGDTVRVSGRDGGTTYHFPSGNYNLYEGQEGVVVDINEEGMIKLLFNDGFVLWPFSADVLDLVERGTKQSISKAMAAKNELEMN